MVNFLDRIEEAETRARELEAQLADPVFVRQSSEYRKVAKEFGRLRPLLDAGISYRDLKRQLEESCELALDVDSGLADMARAEVQTLEAELAALEVTLTGLLTPIDPNDDKNAILEVRAGTGGDEAALFASDLFRMYGRFAESVGWKIETLSVSETDGGGFKEIIALVDGDGVFRRLKFERGVHRVQRVPATETQGRIHTSTVTVAVMPEAEEVELAIDPRDLRIEVMRASGPGGQSVNTTDSAVRITHLPSGVVVQCRDEKSQHKNKAKAMTVLRSRLVEFERQRTADERANERRAQVGTGERSEKIRTYNFPQNRVTDHRAGLTLHKLDSIMQGELNELLDGVMAQITAAAETARESD